MRYSIEGRKGQELFHQMGSDFFSNKAWGLLRISIPKRRYEDCRGEKPLGTTDIPLQEAAISIMFNPCR